MQNVKFEKLEKGISKKELTVDKDALPMSIVYKGKRYILLLTKNDKLILNKYTD